ncbi:phosphoenolpyruvate carboxykinase [bacterium]|nr:phosphoenolpyruvate carboxykinase [bacterium]
MKSIIVSDLKQCYVCKSTVNVEVHHCIHGVAGRKLATKYHLLVGLCPECHRGTNGVHGKNGHNLDNHLKQLAQHAWENKYGNREKWIEIFGKSYL